MSGPWEVEVQLTSIHWVSVLRLQSVTPLHHTDVVPLFDPQVNVLTLLLYKAAHGTQHVMFSMHSTEVGSARLGSFYEG